MATYNGQEFIKEQIESILNQTWTNWCLLISDDGSSDLTLDIINDYISKDSRINIIKNESGYHGAYNNFWYLINYAHELEDFDYYFFSDQDDVWMPDKLKIFIEYAQSKGKEKPLLVYSDMKIINENNEIVSNSLNKILGIGKMSGYTEFYSAGFVWGCAAMINSALFFAIPPLSFDNKNLNIVSHDNFYTKICLIIGNVYFIENALIMHRRHSRNVTSGNTFKLSPIKIIKKGLLGYKNLAKTHALGYSQTLITIHHMRNNGIDSVILEEVEKAINKGGLKAVKILRRHKVKRSQKSRTIGIYVIMFFKSYKKYLIKE